ncbi:peptidoglycan DD-metalloendopeptidase family protein [Mucilaginibacter myungsuensis]|uniref:Peptidoglycan DD-metalloendopeptidase family protein n=1 Tax=Mucilaginibacter myungsuensis TaxID=649104 RepID=A0A929PX69_9SPHI|nr:peptidoglycan DD-metalloendopeptidase family protein [Mucilaginibacter myungsuensis]MBE9662869.1 peptidoglycan DD-metalloendopeptidase family protein [Mucilaginibacter myungsuensis]MDN3598289.1 peptidoglycan DD-metalloendopeptidase family protein [Mucilaginibacter myungsuensis]
MKKLIILIAFAGIAFSARAQYYETSALKKVTEAFTNYYNGGAYRAVYNLFTPAMKDGFPFDKATDYFTDFNKRAGKINSREFVRLEGLYAIYKAQCERGTWTIRLAVDEEREQIFGLYVFPYKDSDLPVIKRNATKLMLPFKGEWDVFWGGDTKEQNYHIIYPDLKNAFDVFIKGSSGKTFKNGGRTNPDYYAFGKELLAPCDGEIVLAVDGIKDNKPGMLNLAYGPGNSVVIRTVNNEYLVLMHFKQFSIAVKQGQQVKQGDLLGLCGNSGNSSEPHLHFHIQNVEEQTIATGVKCYFDGIYVDGALKKDHSILKGEKVRNK